MDTKALRQKVLDLAIRGKLVPQDPNDEPASVLLERIRQQKQQMVKEGKLKAKDIKNDTIIFVGEDNLHYEKFADGTVKCIEDEIPFNLPDGWAWARLQGFVNFIGGSQPPKSTFEYVATEDNIRLIQIRDYKTDKFLTYIPKALARRFCSKDDVMIGRYGPPIFQILRGLEGSYNVALMKAVSEPGIMLNDYLFYLLQDGELLKMLESLSDRTCGQDGINMYELNRYIVGIPPIEEQKRIIQYCEVRTADKAPAFPPVRQIAVPWEILRAGTCDRSAWEEYVNKTVERKPKAQQVEICRRHEHLMEMGPEFCVLGAQNFFGYVVYGFPTLNLYIFESNGINNATYAFRGNWEAASMLTKMEVLAGGLQEARIYHTNQWHENIGRLFCRIYQEVA